MLIMKLFCKVGLHYYQYKFMAYSDQPFANDPDCVVEGRHVNKCKYCGKETKAFKF